MGIYVYLASKGKFTGTLLLPTSPQPLANVGLWQMPVDLPSFSAAFSFPDCKPGLLGSGYHCPPSTCPFPA